MKLVLGFLLLSLICKAATVGPEKGSLVIVGGGAVGPEIWKKFLELAGGPEAPVVYVPTANEGNFDPAKAGEFLKKVGFRDVTVLHTRERKVADTEEFVAPLKRAKAIWFGGGRQWRLVDSYAGTRSEKEFRAVLERGGVIGGSSAGATIIGDYLVRGSREGNERMIQPGYEKGFGYARGLAVDQHLIKRGREQDMWQVLAVYPALFAIGLDEGTALVVHGDVGEVLGVSKMAVYDVKLGAGKHWWMSSGERLDLGLRKRL
jgi:cyanophycinase